MKLVQVFILICLPIISLTTEAAEKKTKIIQVNQFPLRIHPNGKHLTDSNGKPFLMVADVAWQLLRKLSYADAVQYMDIRKSQSFNTFVIQLLPGLPNQKNFNKTLPFQENDIRNPNKAYFDHLEKIVIAAKQRELVVGIVVSRKSWNAVFDLQKDAWKDYGRFVGKRFAKYSNIIWIVSEEENENASQFKAIAAGLREFSEENNLVASLSTCTPSVSAVNNSNRSDLKFVIPDSTVTYAEYANLANWQKNSGQLSQQPFLISNSEFPKEITDQSVLIRNQAYQSIMSSAAGFCHMGTIKNFNPTWKINIHKDGAEYIDHFVKILKGIPWEYMYPNHTPGLLPDSLDQKEIGTVSLTNNRLSMLYIPESRPIHIDLTKLNGNHFKTVWYSPRTGRRWTGPDFTSSSHIIVSPPDPKPGWDWILLVGAQN